MRERIGPRPGAQRPGPRRAARGAARRVSSRSTRPPRPRRLPRVAASGGRGGGGLPVVRVPRPVARTARARSARRGRAGVRVTLSSDVLPEFREYERLTTTVADAYLTPKLGDYLLALAERGARRGLAEPLVMQSSGGVEPLRAAAAHAVTCLLSGPAAGVVGAAYVAGLSGHDDLLTFDMGGTSTDVAPVIGGAVQTTAGTVLGGVPVRLPAVDVHSVSAGGGSDRLDRRGWRTARRAPLSGRRPGAGLLRARRRAGNRDRREPGPRPSRRRRLGLGGDVRLDRCLRPRGADEAGRPAGPGPGRRRRRDRRGRGRRDGPGVAGA